MFQHGLSRTCVFQHGLSRTRVFQHGLSRTRVFQHGLSRTRVFQHGLSRTRVFQHGLSRTRAFQHGLPRTRVFQHSLSRTCVERKFIGEVTYPVFQMEREEGVALLAFPSFARSSTLKCIIWGDHFVVFRARISLSINLNRECGMRSLR